MQKRLLGFITWPQHSHRLHFLGDSIVSYNNFLLIKLSQIINGTPFALKKKSDMQQKKKKEIRVCFLFFIAENKAPGTSVSLGPHGEVGEGVTFLELQSGPREITLPSKPWPRQWLSAV